MSKGTKVLKGRELQSAFRVGKYSISQDPLNIIVSEMKLVANGPKRGMEVMASHTRSYHASYEQALEELLRRAIKDNMNKGNVDMLKGLIDSIQEAKEDILKALYAL